MTEYLRLVANNLDEDSCEVAIWDWFMLAHYLGMHISEFGQTTQDKVYYHETPKVECFIEAFNFKISPSLINGAG